MTIAYQSTSLVVMFKAFLASDHVTEATGKTIAITISKNGGAFGNPNAGATNATEVSSGWYKFTLDTTDTNTVGPLAYRGAVATIDDVGGAFYVIAAALTAADVWAAATRTLSALDEDSTTLDLDATIRSAVGLASANLDTQLGDIPTAAENTTAVLAGAVDGATTLAQSMALSNSALGGKLSGAGTGTETVRDLADSKDRLVYTVDASGNRTAVTRTLT